MTLHSTLRPFARASKAPVPSSITCPTPTSTPCPGPIQYLSSNPPLLPHIPRVNSLVTLPQTRPQTPIGASDPHSPARRIWTGGPPFPEAKMKFEEAVARLRFVEKLPLKELGMLGCGIDEDGDEEGDTQVQKESGATACTGASFYSCRSRAEDGRKMESSWYTCKSKLSNIGKVDASHHYRTGGIYASDSDSDEIRPKLGRWDHHHTSASASSSSSLPIFTYTPLPRPLPICKIDSTTTCSSSLIADFEFTPLPRADTTPFTSPIQPFPSTFPLRTSSSPFYNPGSFPYERSISSRTASSIYPSTSTSSSSGAGPENSHPAFYALPQYSDVESDGSFYRLPQYSDIEHDSFYDEAFVRKKESFGSRASGEVRWPVRAGAVAVVGVDEEMARTGVGRVEDVFGGVEWDEEGEVGEIGESMESWSGGRWDVVEGRDGEEDGEKMESWWGLGRRATV